jgi:hypothetical protein
MTVKNIKDADDALADAHWWMKGFIAAQPLSEPNNVAIDLSRNIRNVRDFLIDLNAGRIRRLGDETAIVLTFREWEQIGDFLMIKPDSIEERDIASAVFKNVHEEYRQQEEFYRLYQRPDAPF